MKQYITWQQANASGSAPLSSQQLKKLTDSSPYFSSLLNYYTIAQQVNLFGPASIDELVEQPVIKTLLSQEGIVHDGEGTFYDTNTFVDGQPVIVAEGLADFQNQLVELMEEGYQRVGEATAELNSAFGWHVSKHAEDLNDQYGSDISAKILQVREVANAGATTSTGHVVTREEAERFRVASAVESLKEMDINDPLWEETAENLKTYALEMGMKLENVQPNISQIRIRDPYHTGKGSMLIDEYLAKVEEESPIFAEMQVLRDEEEDAAYKEIIQAIQDGVKVVDRQKMGNEIQLRFENGQTRVITGDRWNDQAMSIIGQGGVTRGQYTAEYRNAFLQFLDADRKGDQLYQGEDGPGHAFIAFSASLAPKIRQNQQAAHAAYMAGVSKENLTESMLTAGGFDPVTREYVGKPDTKDLAAAPTTVPTPGAPVPTPVAPVPTPGAPAREALAAGTTEDRERAYEALKEWSQLDSANLQMLRNYPDLMNKLLAENKSPGDIIKELTDFDAQARERARQPLPSREIPGKKSQYRGVKSSQVEDLAGKLEKTNPEFEESLRERLIKREWIDRKTGKAKPRDLKALLAKVFDIALEQKSGSMSGDILKDLDLHPDVMKVYKKIMGENHFTPPGPQRRGPQGRRSPKPNTRDRIVDPDAYRSGVGGK